MTKTTATRFERTRRDHTLETAEDYVELIQTLIDESGEARAVDVDVDPDTGGDLDAHGARLFAASSAAT